MGQGCGCLDKAWVGFRNAKRLENYCDIKLYASVIQRVQKELRIEISEFPELGLCACEVEQDENKEQDEEDYAKINFDSL